MCSLPLNQLCIRCKSNLTNRDLMDDILFLEMEIYIIILDSSLLW
jgi:hypothetical protein